MLYANTWPRVYRPIPVPQITCTTRYDVHAEEFLINRPLPVQYNVRNIHRITDAHTPFRWNAARGTHKSLSDNDRRVCPRGLRLRRPVRNVESDRKRQFVRFQRVRDVFAVDRDLFEIFRFREQFSRLKHGKALVSKFEKNRRNDPSARRVTGLELRSTPACEQKG